MPAIRLATAVPCWVWDAGDWQYEGVVCQVIEADPHAPDVEPESYIVWTPYGGQMPAPISLWHVGEDGRYPTLIPNLDEPQGFGYALRHCFPLPGWVQRVNAGMIGRYWRNETTDADRLALAEACAG